MPLPTSMKRGFSFGKSKDPTQQGPKSKPSARPAQSSASALQKAIQKSTFLSGPAPPNTDTELAPKQVRDLLNMLSQPIGTPMLTTSIARLSSPLSRHPKSLRADCLCDTHTWFDLRWIDELTDIVGAEIGPHLNHLRSAPDWLTSTETKEILGILNAYAHIFPAPDPDGSRMAYPYECNGRDHRLCSVTAFCKACNLSTLFQNAEAVNALNICAKGRKRGGRPWPVSCTWLDPLPPRPRWAAKWKKEGLPILSDRIIARRWRKSGRQERMTEGMRSVQAEVIADRDSVARVLDRATREPVKSALVDSDSVYDDIIGRQWSIHEDATQSSSTIDLLRKLGLDDGGVDQMAEETSFVPWARSYETLTANQHPSVRGFIHHLDEDVDDDEGEQAGRSRQFDASNESYTASVRDSSRIPSSTPFTDQPQGKISDSRTASIHAYPNDRRRPDSKAASTSSRDSVTSLDSSSPRSSQGNRATLLGSAVSAGYSSPYLEEGKDDGRTESCVSRDTWACFNNSPLARVKSSGPQTQSMPNRSKLNLIEEPGRNSRYSTAPAIPERSSARCPPRERIGRETMQSRS